MSRPVGFYVQKKRCSSCIYNAGSPLDTKELEDQVRDGNGDLTRHRQCHHTSKSDPACCRGFWDKHKDDFPGGQISQRMGMVVEVDIDTEE